MSEQVPESKDKWDNIVNFLANIKSSPGPLDDQSLPRHPHPPGTIHHSDLKTEMISYLAPFSQQYYLETSLNDRPILKENMMSLTKDILVYTDSVDILKIWSLHNLKANLEIKLHQSPIIEVSAYNPYRTSVPNPLTQEFKDHKINLFGTIDQQGFMKIWTASLYEPEEKIVQTTLMSTQLPEIGKEVKMKFKSSLVFLTLSEADITVWHLSPHHFDCLKDSHSQSQNINEAQGPSRFHTQGFDSKIKDADFSQKNDLIFVCFENNMVRILNVERLDVIKSFQPHIEHPHDHLAKILAYRNIFKPVENKEAVPNDFSLKDIFLTVSNRLLIKVWDLSQITEKSNEGCIGQIKARPNCENEEKPQNTNENLVVEFDFTRNFMFVLWRLKEENILLIYHIDKRFYVYDEETMKNPPLFFDSLKEYKLQSKPLHQIQVINLHDEESKLYFLTEEIACKAANQLNEIQKEEVLNEKKDTYGVCDSKTFFAIFCLYNDFFNFNLILSDDAYPMYLIEDLDKIEKNEGTHAKPEEESKKDNNGGQAMIEEPQQVFPPPLPEFLIKMQQETKLKTEEPTTKTENKPEKSEDNTKMETEDQNAKAFKTIQEDFLSKAQTPFFAQNFLPNQGYLHNPYPSNPYSNIYAPPGNNFSHNPYNNNFHNQMQMTAPIQMNMNTNQRYPGKNKNHKKPKPPKNPPIIYQPRPEPKKPETNNDESKSDIRSPSENYIAPILTEEPKNINSNIMKSPDEKSMENNNSIKSPGLTPQNVNQNMGISPSGDTVKGKTKEKEKDNEKEKEKEKIPQEEFFDRMSNFFEKKLERMREDLEKSMEKKLEALKPNSRMMIEERPAETSLPKDFQLQFNKMFAEQFEKSVTPCFEKYLIKIFEQVNNTFEKGQKFFIEKVNVEQIKSQNIRESLQDALKIFMQISNSLSENLNNNVKNNAKVEVFYMEKQTQLNKMIENVNDVIRKERELQDKIAEIEKNLQSIMIPIKDILENNGKSAMMDEEDEKKTKDREQKESKEKETASNIEGTYDPMSYYKQNLLGNMTTNQYLMQPQQTSYQDQRQPQMQPYVQAATPYFNANYQSMPGYQNQPPSQSNNYQFVNQMNPLNNEPPKQQQQLPNPYQLNQQPQPNQNPGGVFKFPNEIQNEQKLQDLNAFLLSNLAKLQLPLSSYPPNLNTFQTNPMEKNQQLQPINTSNKPGNQMQSMGGFNVNYGPQNSNPSQMQMNPPSQNFQETPKSMNLSSFHLGFLPFYNPNDMGMVPSMTMNPTNQNVPGNQGGSNLNKPKQDN